MFEAIISILFHFKTETNPSLLNSRLGNTYDSKHHETSSYHGQPSLAKPKFTIPQFRGKNDPDAYCEWESKIELMFRYYKCSDDEKVALATLEFSDYALSWWTQLGVNRHRNYEGEISTWDE